MRIALATGIFVMTLLGDPPATPRLKVTHKRDNDSHELSGDKGRIIVTVKCPFGISSAVLERTEERWPKTVVLRLRLRGLENFQADNGTTSLGLAAGLRDGKPELRCWKDGKDTVELRRTDPLWPEVRILDGAGQPAQKLPLDDGVFEVTLPRGLFAGNPRSLTVSWIDFYRG